MPCDKLKGAAGARSGAKIFEVAPDGSLAQNQECCDGSRPVTFGKKKKNLPLPRRQLYRREVSRRTRHNQDSISVNGFATTGYYSASYMMGTALSSPRSRCFFMLRRRSLA